MTRFDTNSAIEELNRSRGLPVYEGFDVAWIAVVKIANRLPGTTEHARLLELLKRLSDKSICSVLQSQGVDTLLGLHPPLESVLSDAHERLDARRTANELDLVRRHRKDDPKLALHKLAEILKRIRNRRAHGFKTPEGPRDKEILGSAFEIVHRLGELAAEALNDNDACVRSPLQREESGSETMTPDP